MIVMRKLRRSGRGEGGVELNPVTSMTRFLQLIDHNRSLNLVLKVLIHTLTFNLTHTCKNFCSSSSSASKTSSFPPEKRRQFDFLRIFLRQKREVKQQQQQSEEPVPLTEHQHDELKAAVGRIAPLIDGDPNVLLNSLTRSATLSSSYETPIDEIVHARYETQLNQKRYETAMNNRETVPSYMTKGAAPQSKPPYKNIDILEDPQRQGPDISPPLPPKPLPPPLPPRDEGTPQKDPQSG